ncbi:hypothetical protein [Roseomonas genomospecies 6]|uniref:Uncharacterized protein n=1 Tax=Roseomonas genomospecies 6 TaxID=214106 RepID=A0A9W7KNG1_9PROT|nr:hypothetical protein [Roseomonas genomospecies 6]KAA0676111.1 hypothetical protein DS843_28530 [Roseomonas genomospecies 6]
MTKRDETETMLADLRQGFGVASNGELLHLLAALGRVVLDESSRDERGRRVLKIVGKGGRERQIVISE